MKKVLFSILFCLMALFCQSMTNDPIIGELVNLHLTWDEDPIYQEEGPKSPPQVPTVSHDGSTLYFYQTYGEVVPVSLADVFGTTVFSSALPIGTTSLVLPSTLSGTYTLYIYTGGYVFCGQINL